MKNTNDHTLDAYRYLTRSIDGGNMFRQRQTSTLAHVSSTSTNVLDYQHIGMDRDPHNYVVPDPRTTVVCGHCRSEMGDDDNTCQQCGGNIRLTVKVKEVTEDDI